MEICFSVMNKKKRRKYFYSLARAEEYARKINSQVEYCFFIPKCLIEEEKETLKNHTERKGDD